MNDTLLGVVIGGAIGLVGSFFNTRMQLKHSAKESALARTHEIEQAEWSEHRKSTSDFIRACTSLSISLRNRTDAIDDDSDDEDTVISALIAAQRQVDDGVVNLAALGPLLPVDLDESATHVVHALDAIQTIALAGKPISAECVSAFADCLNKFSDDASKWLHSPRSRPVE